MNGDKERQGGCGACRNIPIRQERPYSPAERCAASPRCVPRRRTSAFSGTWHMRSTTSTIRRMRSKTSSILSAAPQGKTWCSDFSPPQKLHTQGAGVAAIVSSAENIRRAKAEIAYQTISPDKLNQLRHAKYLKSAENVRAMMSPACRGPEAEIRRGRPYFPKRAGKLRLCLLDRAARRLFHLARRSARHGKTDRRALRRRRRYADARRRYLSLRKRSGG